MSKLVLLVTILSFSFTCFGQDEESFWCVQFFNKSVPHPLHMEIDETMTVGTVIRQFELPKDDNLRVVLNEGDTQYLRYDSTKHALLVNDALKTRLNSVLELTGVCTHNVKSYNYLFNFTVQFFVHVKEHYDPPQFINLPTIHEVPEKTKVDQEIFQVEGEDMFDVNRSNITYKLLSISTKNSWTNVDHMFTMDSQGKVYLKEKLDYDKGLRVFYLEIEIEDTDSPPQTNISTLTIKVTDSDDQPPRFSHSDYHVSLVGEKPIHSKECHSVIPPMKAEDLDPVMKSKIRYKIIGGNPRNWKEYFQLQEDNGTLCQLKTLERTENRSYPSGSNTFPTYVLQVEAYQVDNPQRKHSAKLTIKINNQNIHAPVFSQNLYRANLNEYPALKRNEKIIKVTATDDDYGINKRFRYEIVKNYNNGFAIDQATGDIFVSKPIVVDRENQDKIELKIRAVETHSEEKKESEPHARVILSVRDVNDNSPKFKKLFYNFQIKDSLAYNELVHSKNNNLAAEDRDLAENGTISYTITRVSRQNGRASFDDVGRFKMDEFGNLRVGQSFRDLRRKGIFPEYRVTVKAEDQAKNPKLRRSSVAQVDIKVLEANEYPPVFKNKLTFVSVSEATAIGSRVTKLEATDQDGDEDLYLKYRITGGNTDNTFSISKSGYLTTAGVLDREAETKYTLKVEVSDSLHKAEASVEVSVIDVNDHAPEFTQSTFEFTLMENATEGETFGHVTAIDKDMGFNGEISYSLIGKGADIFGIKPNGDIFVRRISKLLDKEQNDNIILQVKAVDGGEPPSQDVAGVSIEIIDVNDNAPVFSYSTYNGYIEEGQTNLSQNKLVHLVNKIEAIDADKTEDNRNLIYQLIGPGSEKFSLHSVSGELRVKDPASIDCETKCEYKLKVIARDQKGYGLEGRADLLISVKDVNDNPPVFEEDYIINIEPWTPIGTKIKTLKAKDNDKTEQNNKIMYLLRNGGVGKFQLDFDTGDLTVIDTLTRLPALEEYIMEIIAFDSGQPRLSANINVTVRTTVNQQPILKKTHYFEIPESLPIHSVIDKINATNPDDAKGLIQKLKYVIPHEFDVPFKIDADSGVLETTSTLDAETQTKYFFPIIVTDNGYPPGKASTAVTIEIIDINDERPRFSHDIYVGSIVEDDRQPIRGQTVKLVVTTDQGGNGNGKCARSCRTSLALVDFPARKYGDITVIDKLSREPQREQYNLHVLAMDLGYPSLSSNTTVKIVVPVNKPVTAAPTNFFRVSEGVSVGTEIGNVNATDPDVLQDDQHSLIYILTDPTVPFKIENKTGIIKTTGELDAELISMYEFQVQILDRDLPPTTATTNIKVVVEDINDNPPKLSSKIYRTKVSEGLTTESSLVLNLIPSLSAEDKDKNMVNRFIRYFLKGKNSDMFRLNPRVGILKIKDASKLDCEKQQKYKMSIVAFDGTFQSQALLVIEVEDINDNRPIFSSPSFYEVNPRATIGTKFGKVKAIDKDATSRNNRVLYVLVQGSGGKFGVDFLSGDLYVASNLTDSPQKEEYHLIIQGFDSGEPSLASNTTVRVRVTLNKAPVLDPNFTFQIPENMTIGSTVGVIKIFDPDIIHNPQESITFRISDPTNNFAIDTHGKITTKTVLDRESQEQLIFTVICENDGAPSHTVSTTVTVLLEDINDNEPVFKSLTGYHGTYKELDPKTTISLNQEMIATDADVTAKNQNIVYYLVGNDSSLFRLDTAKGSIKVISPSKVRCNYKNNYNMTIIAADQGGKGHKTRSSINIEIQDINDNAPKFTGKYYFRVPKTAKEGTVIGSVTAIDNDCTPQNNKVSYLLKDGGFGKFQIDPDKGEIIISDSLVREPIRNEYVITVKAMDNGVPRLSNSTNVTIMVPVNHPPLVQNSFYFQVLESSPVGRFVGKLLADDKDLGRIKGEKLIFTSSDKTVPFSIHRLSGEIRTNDKLDCEKSDMYRFIVLIRDNGIPAFTATTNIIITIKDVNDNAPLFIHGLEYRGTVIEDDRSPIVEQRLELSKNLTVIDRDATKSNRQIKFSLKGPRSRLFRIDSDTGVIYVSRPGKIDRELNKEFKLKIVATDQNGKGLSTEADLIVEVKDVNDHDPRFVQALYEFILPSIVEAGYEVGRLIAIDRDDTSPNNKLLYLFESDALGKFKIDVGTGVLTLLEGFFSKPRKTTYTFTVVAMDMGFPSRITRAQVIVNAPHMVYNDHAPKFEGRNVFIVKEELPIGSLVGTLQVTDEDRKKNNSVNLIIDPADERYVPFAIKNDGSLVTTKRIDRDAGYEYFRFTIHATDSGAPPYNTSQEVGVIVDDINDNPPHFTMDTYQHMVANSFPASTIIATPFAFDNVDKTDSVYKYSLLGGTPGYFYIDQQTGVIRTTDLAQSLKPGSLEFKVLARDLYNKNLTANAKLKIQIIQSKQGRKSTCCRVPC